MGISRFLFQEVIFFPFAASALPLTIISTRRGARSNALVRARDEPCLVPGGLA